MIRHAKLLTFIFQLNNQNILVRNKMAINGGILLSNILSKVVHKSCSHNSLRSL